MKPISESHFCQIWSFLQQAASKPIKLQHTNYGKTTSILSLWHHASVFIFTHTMFALFMSMSIPWKMQGALIKRWRQQLIKPQWNPPQNIHRTSTGAGTVTRWLSGNTEECWMLQIFLERLIPVYYNSAKTWPSVLSVRMIKSVRSTCALMFSPNSSLMVKTLKSSPTV